MLLNIPCKFWFVVLSSPFCPKFFIRKTLKDLSWVLFSGNAFVLIVFDTCPAITDSVLSARLSLLELSKFNREPLVLSYGIKPTMYLGLIAREIEIAVSKLQLP